MFDSQDNWDDDEEEDTEQKADSTQTESGKEGLIVFSNY